MKNNMEKICNEWLDNADLDINIFVKDMQEHIELIFYVVGIGKKMIVTCSSVFKYSIEKEADELPLYAVFETSIKQFDKGELLKYINSDFHDSLPAKLWNIRVLEGDAKINLICEKLNWKIDEISEIEREWYKN